MHHALNIRYGGNSETEKTRGVAEGGVVIETKEPVQLDFGAFGKGYIIDIIANLLRVRGIQKYTIDAGGDIATTVTIRVGLENPNDFKQVVGVANFTNQSICGSSGNRRKWGRFHHIINPETGESPQHIHAVWVIADTTMLADALTTAVFFVDIEKLKSKYQFEYAIVWANSSYTLSPGFPGEFF